MHFSTRAIFDSFYCFLEDHGILDLGCHEFLVHQILLLVGAEEGIYSNFKTLVDHLRNESLQQDATLGFETRIGVHFNQCQIHVIIYHKIKSKPFESIVIRPHFPNEFLPCGLERVSNPLLDLREYFLVKTHIFILQHLLIEV